MKGRVASGKRTESSSILRSPPSFGSGCRAKRSQFRASFKLEGASIKPTRPGGKSSESSDFKPPTWLFPLAPGGPAASAPNEANSAVSACKHTLYENGRRRAPGMPYSSRWGVDSATPGSLLTGVLAQAPSRIHGFLFARGRV
jgi:hypothetical protein